MFFERDVAAPQVALVGRRGDHPVICLEDGTVGG